MRAEPFSQWVIERGWATPMPALADVGVQVVDAVAPWEALKLRVLNALHTAAALYGLRHGHATVDAVVADPGGRGLLERLAVEIAEVLTAPAGTYVDAYVATTLERFGNSGLGHRCDQIATDSSQKLPVRIVPTLRERLARDLPVDALVDVLALWAWSTRGRAVKDPLTDRFAAAGDDPLALATALVGLPEVFGDLAGNPHLVAAVGHRLADVPGGTTENVR